MDISELLAFSVKNGASDLHVSAGEAPMIRINGDMTKIKMPPIEDKQVQTMVYDIMNDNQRKHFEEFLDLDFSFALGDIARFRVNCFWQKKANKLILYFNHNKTPFNSLKQIDAPFFSSSSLEK